MKSQIIVRKQTLLTTKDISQFLRIYQYLRNLKPKQIFRQKKFKLSHDNKTNNGIYMKRRPFQQKQQKYIHKYRNISSNSIVIK